MRLVQDIHERRARGIWLLNRELLVAARDEFRCWLSLVESSDDPALIIPPLNALFIVHRRRSEHDLALQYLKRALDVAEHPAAPPEERIKVYLNLVAIYSDLGLLDEALNFAERSAEVRAGREDLYSETYYLALTKLYWLRHEWQPAFEAADRVVALTATQEASSSRGQALANRGAIHLEMNDLERAEADLLEAIRMMPQAAFANPAYPYTELGRLYFLRGEYDLALKAGRDALQVLLTSTSGLDKEEVARVSRLFGSIFSLCGQRNLALKYLNRAAAYYSQLGLRDEWQRSTDSIGQVLSSPVRPARSQLLSEVHQLDFLTAVLDMTDDLESVDPYLRGHSERVASLSVLLGRELGMQREELVTLNHAAQLADVGMIAVDSELLHRDGPLTEAELKRVSLHATIGEEMIRPYGFSSSGLQGIRHHHERYDGRGFPDGLGGEQIPLVARVIAVADVYDALTSDRTYRAALTHDEALHELRSVSGDKLDPALVDCFCSLFVQAN